MPTQKQLLETIMAEIIAMKKKPKVKGDLKRIEDSMISMVYTQQKLTVTVNEMHSKIMDPEIGLIVETNKNTAFRETCEPEREMLIEKFKGVLRWKKAIEWGMGVLFVAFVGALIKFFAG